MGSYKRRSYGNDSAQAAENAAAMGVLGISFGAFSPYNIRYNTCVNRIIFAATISGTNSSWTKDDKGNYALSSLAMRQTAQKIICNLHPRAWDTVVFLKYGYTQSSFHFHGIFPQLKPSSYGGTPMTVPQHPQPSGCLHVCSITPQIHVIITFVTWASTWWKPTVSWRSPTKTAGPCRAVDRWGKLVIARLRRIYCACI